MDEKSKVIGIIGLIALRKAECYHAVINGLSKKKEVNEKDKEKIQKFVSEMDNELFISKDEKKNKKINPKLKLKDIDVDTKPILEFIKKK